MASQETHSFPLPSARFSDTTMIWMAAFGLLVCIFGTAFGVLSETCQKHSDFPLCKDNLPLFQKSFSIFFLALGSAMIGAGFTQLASNRKARELLKEVSGVIERSIAQPGLYSTSESLAPFRERFYSYHLTEMNEEKIWRTKILDFSESPAINRLSCAIQMMDENGNSDRNYTIEAFVRGSTLLMIVSPNHAEPTYIHCFPTAGLRFQSIAWGISTHMDFNRTCLVAPCLLSKEPIYNLSDPVIVKDTQGITALETAWNNNFRGWKNNLKNFG